MNYSNTNTNSSNYLNLCVAVLSPFHSVGFISLVIKIRQFKLDDFFSVTIYFHYYFVLDLGVYSIVVRHILYKAFH